MRLPKKPEFTERSYSMDMDVKQARSPLFFIKTDLYYVCPWLDYIAVQMYLAQARGISPRVSLPHIDEQSGVIEARKFNRALWKVHNCRLSKDIAELKHAQIFNAKSKRCVEA